MCGSWSIQGASGERVIGNTHVPHNKPIACAIVAHGFKGYKDYGMIPRIASELALSGVISHRFNFSHSGMTDDVESFSRPDLFERDTWLKQVFDLSRIIDAIHDGRLDGAGLPLFLIGHSRGGVTAILTSARLTELESLSAAHVRGLVTIAAPATANPLTSAQQAELLKCGIIDSPSSRTNQVLRIGRGFLEEQLEDPAAHDVLKRATLLPCDLLIIHGDMDQTVTIDAASALATAVGSRATVHVIPEGDHVLNVPNPLSENERASPQLQMALASIRAFIVARSRTDLPPNVS